MSAPTQKIVAVIVTYRPNPELLMRNFQALAPQVAEIVVVDNSDDATQAESVRQLSVVAGGRCIICGIKGIRGLPLRLARVSGLLSSWVLTGC
jgi:hypothetical protein